MYFSNLASRGFGVFANYKFEQKKQNVINKLYVKLMRLDMSEFGAYDTYESLNDLFIRSLQKKRYINNSENVVISPSDSLITVCENIRSLNQVAQIKSKLYNLDELLTNKISKKNLNLLIGGSYINMYLSPKNYHRYHAPCDMEILKSVYVPAKLFPVNNIALKFIKNLFVKNERVILECKSHDKIFYMVFVGALNVGQMIFNFDKKIATNTKANQKIVPKNYKDVFVKKAEELGYFKMGSTVLMFWQKDMVTQDRLTNKVVKFGNKIAVFNQKSIKKNTPTKGNLKN